MNTPRTEAEAAPTDVADIQKRIAEIDAERERLLAKLPWAYSTTPQKETR